MLVRYLCEIPCERGRMIPYTVERTVRPSIAALSGPPTGPAFERGE
jgi:hypothetical protein